MSQIQTKFSNMYPLPTDLNENNLKKSLASLSVGDSKHDFHYTMDILRSNGFKDAFNYGLPDGGGYNDSDIMDEEQCLSSIIKSYTDKTGEHNSTYIPINVSNPTYNSGEFNEHQITTINGKTFTVNYTDVKPKKQVLGFGLPGKEITADIFYNKLGLNSFENIAIVVDAASIGLFEILKTGPQIGKNVYYIFGPEVVNDPATKKTPDSSVFYNSGSKKYSNDGVKLFSCVPIQKNNAIKFNYNFNPIQSSLMSTPYLNQFYTKYNFVLSDIKENIQGKSREFITNLDIKGNGSEINTLPNSKSKNDITYLESIIQKFLSLFSSRPSGLTSDKKFLISSSLQQKRSGDWLQVLLCAAIKDKIREFKLFNSNNENIVPSLQEVFLVTHDRIALAFALLNGINCIFTHHNAKQHFHSAFAFKLNDPERQLELNRQIAETYVNQTVILLSRITSLSEQIQTYINGIYDTRTNNINNTLNESIRVTLERREQIPYNAVNFIKDIKDFFSKALELIFAKSLYPDLRKQQEELNSLSSSLNTLLSSDLEPMTVIKNYKYIISTIENIEGIYKKANSIDEREFTNKLSAFKKSAIYKTASTWTWDINLSSRDIAILSNIESAANYRLDRNIFLYNLNDLDDDLKEKLAWVYYQTYNTLLNLFTQTTPDIINNNFRNGSANFTERGFVKFKAVSLPFCIEVLLTLAGGEGLKVVGKGGGEVSHLDVTRLLDNYLSLHNDKIQNILITDGIIVKEDNDYNQSLNKGTTQSDINENNPDLNESLPITDSDNNKDVREVIPNQTADTHIIGGSFEVTAKQATYPLMTLILFQENPYKNLIERLSSVSNIGYLSEPSSSTTITEESDLPKEEITNIPKEEIVETKIEPSPILPTTTKPPSLLRRITRSLMRGGSINNKLLDLVNSLPKLSEDNKVFNEISDIFKDNSICFHPLLPIYMITQAYMSSINNESIEESLDFDLFINYFKYLRKIKELVINIYSGENNNNEKKLEAYVIGLCLKQLLFVSNNDENGYQDSLKVLGTDNSIYSKVSSFTESLAHSISGKITYDENVLTQGPIYLNSELFKDFANSIDVNSIFTDYADSESFDELNFRADVLKFSAEVAEKIMSDRGISQVTTSLRQSGIPGFTAEERAEAAARGMAKGIKTSTSPKLRPFDPSRIKTAKDIGFTYSDGEKSNIVTSSTSSSTRSRGGKKKKFTRRPNKNHKNHKNHKNKTKKRFRKHKKTRKSHK